MPITDTAIKNAKPGNKTRKMYDSGGLYLEQSPRGGKWWRFKYRFNGKVKRTSLGVYPDISLKDARDRRDAARKLVAHDVDPAKHRKAEKATNAEQANNSFEVIAREWFEKYSSNRVSSHADRILRRLERDIFPWIGSEPVATLTSPQLLETIRRIEQRGALETAHRAFANCGQVFRYAIATGRADRDPAAGLRSAIPPVKGTNFAAVTDPKKVDGLLRAIDDYEGTLIVKCALRLAPLVFVRPGELRQAQWSDIDLDLDQAEWRFTVTKTKMQHNCPPIPSGHRNFAGSAPCHRKRPLRLPWRSQQNSSDE